MEGCEIKAALKVFSFSTLRVYTILRIRKWNNATVEIYLSLILRIIMISQWIISLEAYLIQTFETCLWKWSLNCWDMAVTRPRESRTLKIPQYADIPLNHWLINLWIITLCLKNKSKAQNCKRKSVERFCEHAVY